MTTLDLDDRIATALRDRAKAHGLTLEAYLQSLASLPHAVPTPGDPVKDFDAALEELFAADTRTLPADSPTYSREDIYLDHD